MNLIDNELDVKKEKNTRMIKIIIICMLILFVIGGSLLGYLSYLQSKQFKFFINGKTQSFSSDLFYFDNGEIYISIKDLVNVLKNNSVNYEINNGVYKEYDEDITKNYIKSVDEVAGYEANSQKMYKVVITDNVYEYFNLDKKVISRNGKLYTTPLGIEIGFNVKFYYNNSKNQVQIQTLDYLVQTYAKKLNNTVITSKDMSFSNKKALKYDMIIIKSDDGQYGVNKISTGESVLGTKYTELKFVESTQDFIVTTPEKKQGIISTSGGKSIEPQYTSIQQLDAELNLYLVKNDKNKFGVFNREKQAVVIYPEYDSIGIEKSKFPNDEIKNQYILYDYCIPCKKVENGIEKWELINKDGDKITQKSYDALGYIKGTSKEAKGNNLLVIPEIEGIIVYNDSMYGIISSSGKTLVPIALQQVYSEINGGKNTYYMVYNNQTVNILEMLEKTNSNNKTNAQDSKNQNNTNSNSTTNSNTNAVNNTIDNNTVGGNTTNNTTANNTTNNK